MLYLNFTDEERGHVDIETRRDRMGISGNRVDEERKVTRR